MGLMDFLRQRRLLTDGKGNTCVDCKTTTTPQWRNGPAGPRYLCNACGIRLGKMKRTSILALNRNNTNNNQSKKEMERSRARITRSKITTSAGNKITGTGNTVDHQTISATNEINHELIINKVHSLKIKFRVRGNDVFLRSLLSSPPVVKKQRCERRRRELREEEKDAAFALMALSSGHSVFAYRGGF